MQHRAARIFRLQRFLALQRLKRVIGEANRQLRRIGVVRLFRRAGLQDAGKALLVLLGEAVSGASAGVASRLYMWPVSSWKSDDPRAHMIEEAQREGMAPAGRDIVCASAVKLRIISLMPFTPIVEKWLRSVPR